MIIERYRALYIGRHFLIREWNTPNSSQGRFSLQVSEKWWNAKKHRQKTQRNKQEKCNKICHKAQKLDFQQISFLEVDVAVVFFDVENYSAWITLFSILCYLNQGTNQKTEPIGLVRTQGPLPVINSQFRREKRPRVSYIIIH